MMKSHSKKCFRCGVTKQIDEFYRHPQMSDGHLGKCKSCTRVDVRKNYKANVGYYRAYDAGRYEERYNSGSLRADPEKDRCRKKTRSLIKAGEIQRKSACEKCGCPNPEIHHHDYGDPYDISFLCKRCHADTHAIEGKLDDALPLQR